jgi:hypothetical protein
LAFGVISSGTNEPIAINAKGSAAVNLGNVSSGGVNLAAGGGGATATAIQGGSAAGSSITIKSTTNGSPSGDVASLLGSTVTIGNPTVGTSTINLSGPVGGGVTVNIAGASNGLTALNVFNSTGGKQIWIPGAGGSPGTLQFPATADTLVGKATTDAFTNKTFNSTATGNVLQVSGVTVSAGQYPGETTTGSASAGNVGEYVESIITVARRFLLSAARQKRSPASRCPQVIGKSIRLRSSSSKHHAIHPACCLALAGHQYQ